MKTRVVIGVAAALVLVAPSRGRAQDTPPTAWGRGPDANGALSHSAAAWLGAWSPLRPIVEAPRGLVRAPLAPGILDAPEPAFGAFILSGAPGALARDLARARGIGGDTTRYAELRARSSGVSGDFRRPLDPAEVRVEGIAGQGWAPVRGNGMAIGRLSIDREALDPSSFTSRVAPYASSPFVSTDSVTPPMRRVRARIEGALGYRFGEYGAGIAAGLESREHTTFDFPLRRAGRSAAPSVNIGVERTLPWLDARVGTFYRWAEPTETDVLNPSPLPTIYYPLRGYDEPVAVPVTSSSSVFSRIDSRATAAGATLELTAWDTRVAITHERGARAEDGYFAVSQDRPTNRWRADGSETRVQLQRRIAERFRVTVVGASESLAGDAQRLDLTGVAYRGDYSRRAIEADVRMDHGQWSAAAQGGAVTLNRTGVDYAAELAADLDVLMPFVGGEVARHFTRGAVAAGASYAASAATGRIPVAAEAQENYQRLIAPALAYEAADTRAMAWWITSTFRVARTTLIGGVRFESTTSPTDQPQRLQPAGSRDAWTATLGVRY